MSSDYTSRARQFHNALSDAFSAPDTEALVALTAVVQRCRFVAANHDGIADALDALDAVAARGSVDEALSEATSLFESAGRFREALFFVRCLDHDAPGTLDLMAARDYMSGAVVPVGAHSELALEQARLLEATAYEALWRQPEALAGLQAAIDAWREVYSPVYAGRHAVYAAEVARIAAEIETAQWQSAAVEKLNGLEGLGPPLGVAALHQFRELEKLFACPSSLDELMQSLAAGPTCPHCGFRLDEAAPSDAVDSMLGAVAAALATHRRHLDQRVVVRLLASPGRVPDERLQQLIDAVQSADDAGMAASLSEGLIEFIADMLDVPQSRANLIAQLAREHPEVTDADIESVVASFRRLLEAEVERGGGRIVLGSEDEA